jgi:hypothetical protein
MWGGGAKLVGCWVGCPWRASVSDTYAAAIADLDLSWMTWLGKPHIDPSGQESISIVEISVQMHVNSS